MDNRELIDAANALIQWSNNQGLKPRELEEVMSKVCARIITDRLGLKKDAPPPSQDAWSQEILAHGEALMHNIVERVYRIHGRR